MRSDEERKRRAIFTGDLLGEGRALKRTGK